MADSDMMNELLERIGVNDRAVPGTTIGPTFYVLFSHMFDKIEALEQDVARLRDEVRYPDKRP